MHVIHARNVNDAWSQAVNIMLEYGKPADSRAGKVLVAPWPVTTVYAQPCERVLFDPVRNANPFFHFVEAMWMLNGGSDGTVLNRFVANFTDDFAEASGEIHGAYGYRWRKHFGYDQLNHIVDTLKANPNDRQCVLSMWDATAAMQKGVVVDRYEVGANDLKGKWKDRPCNTQAYFRVNDKCLDMTVMCRSNDIYWGAYGANAVHFSFLLEYMAGRIGVPVGVMYQVSNNWHAYEKTFRPYIDAIEDADPQVLHGYESTVALPIGQQWQAWDGDLARFMAAAASWQHPADPPYTNSWFNMVAIPILLTHQAFKRKHYSVALEQIKECAALDWRIACSSWMTRTILRGRKTELADAPVL